MRAVVQRVTSAVVSVRKELSMPVLPADTSLSQNNMQQIESIPQPDSNLTASTELATTDQNVQVIDVASSQIVQEVVGEIADGLVVFLGIGRNDTDADVAYLVDRTLNLRIFRDDEKHMNLSLLDVGGSVLVVSQFTLYGDARKGRRPSFFEAMDPTEANGYYMSFCKQIRDKGVHVETGSFGADMRVSLINDGPVTILLDSKKEF